ncbi:hypothetical protein J3A84_09605 [Proteiniclasticum sp. SCR006]|uniref:Uncharacterized protein n=1 Tax=Proteiniclasticum aestuarii TaxID=2817862 RepID=A0A939HDH5_9CLOT|nr:hypothetical protein [Proteiniclasticum aestuarii]MBO1265283.1 hypothetical protein [Proteiniclasticum aestuarii]
MNEPAKASPLGSSWEGAGPFSRRERIRFYIEPEGGFRIQINIAENKTSKGTIQFPVNRPLQEDLIREIVTYRALNQNNK